MTDKEKSKPVRPSIRDQIRAKMREQQLAADGNSNAQNGDIDIMVITKPRPTETDRTDVDLNHLQNENGNGPAPGISLMSQPSHCTESNVGEDGSAFARDTFGLIGASDEVQEAPSSKRERTENAEVLSGDLQPSGDQVDGSVPNSRIELHEASGDCSTMYSATNTTGVTFPRRPQTLTTTATAGSVSVRSQIDKFSGPSTTSSQISPTVSTTGMSNLPGSNIRSGSYVSPSAGNLTPSPSASSNGTPNPQGGSDSRPPANGNYDDLLQRARSQVEREFSNEFATTQREQDSALSRLESENRALQAQIEQYQHANEELRFVIAAYDEQIAKLDKTRNANVDESKRRLQSVEAQRDQAISEVLSLEKAFSDLHRRLEVSKHCLMQQVERERQQAQQLEESMQRVKRWESKYAQLKQHAEEKLSLANREIEKIRKHSSAELVGLEALVKKLELERNSVSEALARKSAEVDELHKICDELLMKLNQRDIP